ncbi:multidrug transporter MatE [Methanobrevibacter sp. 87.7]|uniref:flippase n=1 Tax=Methanobrevibacter sp. 87.7 TaxID=387957 RepID=UPI000B50CC37|nr:flippase [Methanobrevibacter sp. 87.7]OWT33718.1 multidrug transporter MatE [Methanobrevibacter sp. 87.7]
MTESKIIKGSFFILIGNVIFRIGGYLYRFLMASLLGPAMYGILGLTLPFQGVFQILSAGGLPPAIAKYVSEYNTLNQEDMAKKTIRTSLKIMVFLGILMGFFMITIVAPWLAYSVFKNPTALLPLQAVGLITPFSVIVGAFRGAFQGVYKMEYIVATRAIEQMTMIIFATGFVLIGLQAFGAVLGSVLGFFFSSLSGIYIYKKYMGKYLKNKNPNFKIKIKDEIKLAKKLISFAIPVTITSLAEMIIYSISTFIMGIFLTSTLIGYFTAADPIARLPLMVSTSIATTILPAAAEAYVKRDKTQLNHYVFKSYEYSILLTLPLCIFIMLFAKPIMRVVYFTNAEYSLGGTALAVLVIGMTFYALYSVSTGIIQGIGHPKISMYILLLGSGLNVILNWFFIQKMGIVGGALATTISTVIFTIPTIYITLRLTESKLKYGKLTKIILASVIMGIILYLIPNNTYGLLLAIILSPIIYIVSLIYLRIFESEDIERMKEFSGKFGPLEGIYMKIVKKIEEKAMN